MHASATANSQKELWPQRLAAGDRVTTRYRGFRGRVLELIEVRANPGYSGGWAARAKDEAGKETPRLALGWFRPANTQE